MKTLLFDVETSGLDVNNNHILEVGAMLVDEQWEVLEGLSFLVSNPSKPVIDENITKLTGITQEMIDKEGAPLQLVAELLSTLGLKSDFVCAYNAEFDGSIFKTEMFRNGLTMLPGINNIINIPWLCAMKDIESNYGYKCWKLSHLALDYGVSIDPSTLHRAINDVELMRQMLIKTGVTVADMLNFQQIPWIYVSALIPAPWTDGGKGKDEAVKMGYSWQRAKNDSKEFEKTWVKKIKANKLDDEIKNCSFKIRQIGV